MAFVVYKSSAGSGKTYTLVKEYLKLVLTSESPYKYRHILAITFTNKAAAEMKERVLLALEKLEATPQSPLYDERYLTEIATDTNLPTHVVQLRAANILATILHNYSDFSISTIDSFVHRVVKAFAYDLGIPLSFTVDLDADKLLTYAVDELISRAGTADNEALTQAILAFAKTQTDIEKSWKIAPKLKEFAFTLLTTEGKLNTRKLSTIAIADIVAIRADVNNYILQFENTLKALGQKAVEVIENYNIPIDAFFQTKSGIGAYFTNLAQGRTDKLKPSENVKKTIYTDKWYAAGKENPYAENIDACKHLLKAIYLDIEAILQSAQYQQYVYYVLTQDHLFSLALLNELQKIIDQHVKLTGSVHLSEFDDRLATVIQNEPIPFVYERLGERYEHYLIDEFQDTSTTQWENLLPLLDNALANGHFNMVVGDGKQAIYRWRGGNVEQFANLPSVNNPHTSKLLAERADTLARAYKPENLVRNFRSRQTVIEFNNTFFEFTAKGLDDYQTIYHGGNQEFDPKKAGGYVAIDFVADKKADPDADIDDLYCKKVFEIINQCLADGFALGDIAVLTRNKSKGAIVAHYLTQQGLAIVSADSLLLNANQAVKAIIALFNYHINPQNQLAAATLLEQVLTLTNQTHLIAQLLTPSADAKKVNYTQALQTVNPALVNLQSSGLSLFEFYELGLRTLGLATTPNPYLLRLADCILQFTGDAANSIEGFINWWNEENTTLTVTAAENDDAIKVMTIHKSKGLQFPVVIFPNLDWYDNHSELAYQWMENTDTATAMLPVQYVALTNKKFGVDAPFNHLIELENKRKKLDNVNMLYVAFTRPEERLYILSTIGNRADSMASFVIDFLKDQHLWAEDSMHYPFGEPAPYTRKAKPQTQGYQLTHIPSEPWQNRIIISTQAKKVWGTDDTGQRPSAQYGRALHQILEYIITPPDLRTAINKALTDGSITLADVPDVETRIKAVLTNPEYSNLFDPQAKVWAEREIILPDGSVQRPDRVVELGNQLTIADYKTGMPKPAHQTQIQGYAQTLQAMGYANVKTVIVYL